MSIREKIYGVVLGLTALAGIIAVSWAQGAHP